MPSPRKKRGQTKVARSRESKSRNRQPLWKKALFAALTTVLFFGLLELIFCLVGVKPLLYEEDPYVGFTSQIPLFVEQGGGGSGARMETARNK